MITPSDNSNNPNASSFFKRKLQQEQTGTYRMLTGMPLTKKPTLLLQADLFVMAEPQKEEENDPAKTGYGIELSEEERTRNLDRHKDRICKECFQVIDGMISNKFKDQINEASKDPQKLAAFLSEFIKQIKEKTSLRNDQTGFEGNELRIYINNFKAPQFNCDYESKIVIETLSYLKKKLKDSGSNALDNYNFYGESLDYHSAVGVTKKGGEKDKPIFILDTWIAGKGEAPKIFMASDSKTAKQRWEKAVQEFSSNEGSIFTEFNDSHKYKFEDLFKENNTFQDKWFSNRGGKLHWLHGVEPIKLDYFFLKYYASPNSELKEAIPNDYFELMRDKIIYFLEKESKLTKDEKVQLSSLSLLNKSTDEQKAVWKALTPFVERYFEVMYPGSKVAKKIFTGS